ncbi:MAG: carboxypeptidase-like regulatory domain-containing protein, partial [Flavisolibacter sp.]|nr:carboxypeptidase-like regulatory domain-containing protein [Flavisolibacter sp.]
MKTLCILLFFVVIASSVWAQQIIRGTVRDAKGASLEGVTVSVKGQQTTTTTKSQGFFTIAAVPGSTLVFSSFGFRNYEVAVGNQTSLTVSLQETSAELNEVVVTGVG